MELERRTQQFCQQTTGEPVIISAPASLQEHMLPTVVRKLQNLGMDRFRLRSDASTKVYSAVANSEADVGLALRTFQKDGVVAIPIFEGELMILCPSNTMLVKYFSDRIGVMYYGQLMELADSSELFAHPLHPYTKALFSAIPRPDPLSEKLRVKTDYDRSVHNYDENSVLAYYEISPNHFVYCTEEEAEAYARERDGEAPAEDKKQSLGKG